MLDLQREVPRESTRERLRELPGALPRELPAEISENHRMALHAALFVASFLVYALFRSLWTAKAGQTEPVDGSLTGSIAILFIGAALAYGTASWFQPRWRSRDAGRVASIVWLVVSLGYMLAFGCPRIVLLVGLAFFPYCLGALVGHNIGRFHHPAHWDGIEMDLDD